MREYTGFAQVYDEFMDNVPYDVWADKIEKILKENGITGGLVLELGCGTGNITRRMQAKGYDMIGLDMSEEMLEIAKSRTTAADDKTEEILYLHQDMRAFELFGTVNAIICICDSINYITEDTDMISIFKLCNNYLEAGGLLIIDFNTPHYYRDVLAGQTIAENRENASLIWENEYDTGSGINDHLITIYSENEMTGEYERFEEEHFQKAYSPSHIKRLMKKAGLEVMALTDVETGKEAARDSERVYAVAKETFQKGKHYEKL